MRVFCDSNALLSAALFPDGRVAEVYDMLLEQKHSLITSDYVLAEVRAVAERKFPARLESVERFVSVFQRFGLVVPTPNEIEPDESRLRDSADRPVFRAARASGADVLLTGDKDLLEAGVDRPEVISASALRTRLR